MGLSNLYEVASLRIPSDGVQQLVEEKRMMYLGYPVSVTCSNELGPMLLND